MSSLRIAFVLTFVALLARSAAYADSYTAIPGTRVSLVLPEKFEVASEFAGIGWRDAGASLHIIELPAPAEQMKASFTKADLASKGMALLRSEDVETAMGPARLFHASQVAQGMEFRKWLLVAGSADTTVMLTATAPSTVADDLEDTFRRCLLTARWEPQRVVDPLAGLGFAVSETSDLKVASSMMGAMILLTKGGVKTTASPGDPFAIVGRSTAEVAISDLAAYSRKRLTGTIKIADIEVEQESERVIAGMPGYELVASATAEGSTPVAVYQALAYDGQQYFLIQGRVGVGEKGRYLEQFRQIARSLSIKK